METLVHNGLPEAGMKAGSNSVNTKAPTADGPKLGSTSWNSVQRQLDRILSSPRFRRSDRMSRFLRTIVLHALENGTPPAARQIAAEVFDRPDFDSRSDPIVRVEARRLRRLLADYYNTEGSGDPVVIALPGPGYQPHFIRGSCRDTAGVPSNPVTDSQNGALKSIVVLPFVNMTNDPNQEAFCEGITEEVINALTRIDYLKVASRTSAFQYKDPHDIRDIGHELGVAAVLEGSVRRAERRIRVTAQLSSVSDGFHLCSETFDATFEDSFTLQEELAKAIARMVDHKLQGLHNRSVDNDLQSSQPGLRGGL
jgi:adenylate cyclase